MLGELPITWAIGVLAMAIVWLVVAFVLRPRDSYSYGLRWVIICIRAVAIVSGCSGLVIVAVYGIARMVGS